MNIYRSNCIVKIRTRADRCISICRVMHGSVHVRRIQIELRLGASVHLIAPKVGIGARIPVEEDRPCAVLRWNNSTLLHGDVVSAIIALKAQPGPELQMIGSGNLIQTLQAASLIDEYNVWTFPVVLGRGKRLFSETAKPSALRLVRSQVSTTGVVMSTYVPGGDIQPGSFASAEPSEKELARRKKMANEMW